MQSSAFKLVLTLAILAAATPAVSAERETVIAREAYACSSWAAWREYGAASLSKEGARASKDCPIRISPGAKVTVTDDDAGEGAAEIRYRGKAWFVDEQRLK